MYALSQANVEIVSGGQDCSGAKSSSVQCPVANPQSEVGKMVDDIAGVCNDVGSAIGGAIYDLFH